MNESNQPMFRPEAEHILDRERKPSSRRRRRRKGRREEGKIGTRTQRGGRERKGGGGEISLPACSAESSQQVRA